MDVQDMANLKKQLSIISFTNAEEGKNEGIENEKDFWDDVINEEVAMAMESESNFDL